MIAQHTMHTVHATSDRGQGQHTDTNLPEAIILCCLAGWLASEFFMLWDCLHNEAAQRDRATWLVQLSGGHVKYLSMFRATNTRIWAQARQIRLQGMNALRACVYY
jgi:hypothetical protein